MEQFEADDLFIQLMAKRKECLQGIYQEYQRKIEEFLKNQEVFQYSSLNEYFAGIEEAKRKREETVNKKRKADDEQRRKSMIVQIDDMSFCFGKEELQQLTGQDKEIDPDIKDALLKMNEIFKQMRNK
ncbi:hypothetical protein NEFER03_1278 [Nematocida sp. LUAm3]|nr:hypothetical protein NEFER03_1278 [Nematocida sp. LUAm3]KAI5174100.1 hypothetical protein NEFER02_0567 [Nematocida sp. LUAm2]KAI5177157.1 hypothetical protein NEFER01_0432 [Nematocida sp. LUAm1]